jgi:hypothetical protein
MLEQVLNFVSPYNYLFLSFFIFLFATFIITAVSSKDDGIELKVGFKTVHHSQKLCAWWKHSTFRERPGKTVLVFFFFFIREQFYFHRRPLQRELHGIGSQIQTWASMDNIKHLKHAETRGGEWLWWGCGTERGEVDAGI